jgi:hypothetical protein
MNIKFLTILSLFISFASFADNCTLGLDGEFGGIPPQEKQILIDHTLVVLRNLGYKNVCVEDYDYETTPSLYVAFDDMRYDGGWFVTAEYRNPKNRVFSSNQGKFFNNKNRALKKFDSFIEERVPNFSNVETNLLN